VVSALIFGVIIGIFLYTTTGGNEPDGTETAEPTQTPGGSKDLTENLQNGNARTGDVMVPGIAAKGSVKVVIEVRDKARNIALIRAKVRVFKRSEADHGHSEIANLWSSAPRTASGKVSFALPPGKYEIRAQAPRYTGDNTSITLVKGQPEQKFVLSLERGTSITGIVVDFSDKPVSGATVFAFKELADPDADIEEILRKIVELQNYTGTVHSLTTTDTDGRFQLDGLENFWYTVRAVSPGYTPGEVSAVSAPNKGLLKVVIQPGGILAGTVRDSGGQPIGGAKVMAFPELEGAGLFEIILSKARPPVEEFETAADGTYKLQSLGAGLYNFLVNASEFQEHSEMKLRVAAGDNPTKDFTLVKGHVIEGYVRGPQDEPIVGARVRANAVGVAGQTSRDQIRIDMKDSDLLTDEEGFFRFDTLLDARYMLLVHHEDYESLQRKDVRPNEQPINLRLGFGARVYGTVVDAGTGEPIPGASVSASDVANLRKDATTDQEGQYVLNGLGSNRRPVTIYVKADGYARVKVQVTVRKGREYEENFELKQTGTVEGMIVDSSNNPLPGAHIEVRPAEGSSATLRVLGNTSSESDGTFTVDYVEPGESLQVRVKLSAYLETYSAEFSINSGETHDVGSVVLQLGGEIAGKVVDKETKAAVNGVWIEARPEGDTDLTPGASVQSDSGGKFQIRGLQAGKYKLIAKANAYIETALDGVEVREGFRNDEVMIELEKGGVLAGVVKSTVGDLIQGAEVVVRDFGDGIQERRTVSNGKGKFEFNNIIAADEVEVEVKHQDYGNFSDKAVKVGTSDLEVVLKPLGSIVGVVIDPEGRPMDSFTVQPQSNNVNKRRGGARLRAKTFNPEDGRFEYRGIPDGIYSLSVRSLKFSAVTLEEIEVRAGETIDVGEIQLAEGGSVNGRVVIAGTNQPIVGAKIRVLQGAQAFQANRASPVVTTDANGGFVISGLKDRVISLDVTHVEFASERVSSVDPRVGAKSQNLLIELEQPGQIIGTIVDAAGKLAKGMPIYLVAKGKGSKNDSQNSDANGEFQFRKVSSGAYTVRAHRFGKAGAQVDVEVFSGDTVEVRLQLEE
jgi:protocatechuate 3,4-dioxygenase beta subunit